MRTFPIFVAVDRKPPLVLGGGELAAIKARLLLKRAPSVDVAADEIASGLEELRVNGSIALLPSRPGVDQVRGRPLVVCASGDDEEDARVAAIARALGVPVNVPDRPALCTFVMPAIVDRGEVTIAIGTDGAAPVLAQRLRAWLERELPTRLDALAKLARELRDSVAARLPAGPRRRKFWESIFDGRASEAVLAGEDDFARGLIGAAIDKAAAEGEPRGRVLLVGAGPGDPDLLTLKAVRALKTADVILYDRLPGTRVLDHARREALLVSVGKTRGAHSVRQEDIHALMIEHAAAGKTVVRLKGGDPLVFGRAGEEIAALRAAGIDSESIPGITSSLAAAASLKLPLTHRDLSHSVTFISGQEAKGAEPSFAHVDFTALKPGENTLVVYMGVATAPLVAGRLLDAGWPASCPLVAVENATSEDERRIAATLGDLAAHPERLGLKSPAVLIFGDVAGLADAALLDDVLATEHARRVYA
jgi:uroporphyrin-III C-methyltransferase/precorrin-2 dehydrogenase/sirohydrochlorin ferrochelatase